MSGPGGELQPRGEDWELQVVLFEIEGVTYGVEVDRVLEVILRPEVSRVPSAVACVEGVINLRGSVIPVLDLRQRLRLGGDASRATHIVIALVQGTVAGLSVDGVSQVARIPVASVAPPPAAITGPDVRYVEGIAKLEGGLCVLLDLDLALRPEELLAVRGDLDGK